MITVIFISLAILITFGLLALLQIGLSKRENRFVGLVIPAFFLFFSVILTVLKAEDSVMHPSIWAVIFNIPTLIMLIIYLVCRKNRSTDTVL